MPTGTRCRVSVGLGRQMRSSLEPLNPGGQLATDRKQMSFMEFCSDGTLGGRALRNFSLPERQGAWDPSGLLVNLQGPEGTPGSGGLVPACSPPPFCTHAMPSSVQTRHGPLGSHPSSPTDCFLTGMLAGMFCACLPGSRLCRGRRPCWPLALHLEGGLLSCAGGCSPGAVSFLGTPQWGQHLPCVSDVPGAMFR